jgi:hypothetical protein
MANGGEPYDGGTVVGLYKYVTASTAIRILEGSIRFTQPGAFNDPFEFLPQFIVPPGYDEKELNINFCMFSPRRKGLDRAHTPGLSEYRSDIQAREMIGALNRSLGVLCLTRNSDSLLMWGHYAHEYSGALLEFDEKHEFFEGLNAVSYKKRRPVYDIKDFLNGPIPISDMCVKSNVWSYEKEVRLVRSAADCKSMHLPSQKLPLLTMGLPGSCIKSLHIGERMSIPEQRRIWSLVKDTDIALGVAAVANWDYGFRYEPIKPKGPLIASPIISPFTGHIFADEPGELGELARWAVKSHPMAGFVRYRC